MAPENYFNILNTSVQGNGSCFPFGNASSNGLDTNDFINSIYTLSTSNGTTGQKVQQGTKLGLQFLLSLVNSKEEASATKEVNDNTKAANDTERKLTEAAAKTQERVTAKISEMEANAQKVQELIAKLDETAQKKDDYQKQIEEKVQRLNQIKEDIKANPEKASAYLAELTEIGASIQALASELETLASSVEEATSSVETLQNDNADINDEANNIVDEGVSEQQSIAQEVVAQQATNATTGATAVVNNTQAIAAGTQATAMEAASKSSSFIPGFGAIASSAGEAVVTKLRTVETDQFASANIRNSGFTSNVAYLSGLNNMISTNLTDFSSFPTAIGSALSDTEGYIADFTNLTQPIGEWLSATANLGEEANSINEAVAQFQDYNSEEEGSDTQNAKEFNYDTSKLEEMIA